MTPYPTDEQLDSIQGSESIRGALLMAEAAWAYPRYVTRELRTAERAVIDRANLYHDREYIRFVTLGWSGNESIIAALNQNLMVRALTWRLSSHGGLHIYELIPPASDLAPASEELEQAAREARRDETAAVLGDNTAAD